MLRLLPMIACLTFIACPAGCAGKRQDMAPAQATLWVDPAREDPGQGTRERPLNSLPRALVHLEFNPRTPRVHLAPGRYEGGFQLPEGVVLEGSGAGTVLVGKGTEAVVRAPRGARLEAMTLEGGGWGVEGGGTLGLRGVRFQGQGQGAVRMEGGRLEVAEGLFEAGGEGAVGVAVSGGARGEVRESVFSGPFRRGVEARDAEVALSLVRFQGARTALHQARGRGVLRDVQVEGGPDVGLYVHGGALRLEDVSVTGHEYGLQSLEATLEVERLTSVRAVRAGLALLGSRGTLASVRVVDSGPFGAVSLLGSELVLRDLRVEGAREYGVAASRGRLRLERALLTGLKTGDGDAGDGLHLRDVEVDATGLVVRDAAGVGVLAAQGARVRLRGSSLESCRSAGVMVETQGQVTATGLELHGSPGPALVVLEGSLRGDALLVRDNAQGLLAADCQAGAHVALGRVSGQGLGSSGSAVPACVGPLSP